MNSRVGLVITLFVTVQEGVMPDTLTRRTRMAADDSLPRSLALLEAIEVTEVIVIPGVDALLDAPQDFAITFDASIALSGMLRTHTRRIGVMKRLAVEALDETGCGPAELARIPSSLPVRAVEYIARSDRWSADPQGARTVRVAFAFVAAHTLTDPTDCHTASRALHLRPRPLHDERALLQDVLRSALGGLSDGSARLMATYISKASAFFAQSDDARWSVPSDRRRRSAPRTIDYNPDALREACRAAGLDMAELRIAARREVR
ncbi:hypothetical protein VZC37_12835 [Gordonia sp. LSe1-13]|uniref:Uncharacterized protein n=1 Tax=Gordonia sesuvii TaxID=3116777 RepID=A0ABU7MDW6_9ACTN|nr:hypothetical protein [Gordonia sp. LSe1-13]